MCFCACLKSHFLDSSQFRNLHVNTIAIHLVILKESNVRYAFPTSELVH